MRTNVLSIPMLNFNGNSIFEHFDREHGEIGFLHVFNSSKGTARNHKKTRIGTAKGCKGPTTEACQQVLDSRSLKREQIAEDTKSWKATRGFD